MTSSYGPTTQRRPKHRKRSHLPPPDKHGTAKRVLIRYYDRTEADCIDPDKCYRAMEKYGYRWDEKAGVWRA